MLVTYRISMNVDDAFTHPMHALDEMIFNSRGQVDVRFLAVWAVQITDESGRKVRNRQLPFAYST